MYESDGNQTSIHVTCYGVCTCVELRKHSPKFLVFFLSCKYFFCRMQLFFFNLRFHEMGKTQKHQSKGAANLDSQQDSTADCAEGDYVTLATVREFLKVQESTFKWLFESMIQLDSVVKDVQEMKTSLQYSQKDVESLCILVK